MASAPASADSHFEVVVVDKVPETVAGYAHPCIDCGQLTGNWCAGCEEMVEPPKSEPKPLCTLCEEVFIECHNCRGISMAMPAPWWQNGKKVCVLKG
jgi:hypothetical protein